MSLPIWAGLQTRAALGETYIVGYTDNTVERFVTWERAVELAAELHRKDRHAVWVMNDNTMDQDFDGLTDDEREVLDEACTVRR